MLVKSWSIGFIKAHLVHMDAIAALRLWWWRWRPTTAGVRPTRPTRIRTRPPFPNDILLRKDTTDLETFDEIFVAEIYASVCKLQKCDYIVDLGANIGLASLMFVMRYPKARIFALEPAEENFSLLQHNLSTGLKSGRIQAEQAAIWNSSTVLKIEHMTEGRFSGTRVADHSKDAAADSVRAYAMPTLLERAGFPHIDLLKVDIEGAEVALLEGDTSWLEKVNLLAIEFHGDSRQESGFDALMAAKGFDTSNPTPHTTIARRVPKVAGSGSAR